MRSKEKILVSAACLKWARNRARLSTLDLATKIGVLEDTVRKWEDTGEVSFSQINKIADFTHVALGYLFLPEPPVEKLPIADFRTIGSLGVNEATPELLDTLNNVLSRQDWYREYARLNEAPELDFIGSLTIDTDIREAAEKIRLVIDWDIDTREHAKNWKDALKKQIELVEEAGILVMGNAIVENDTHRKLDIADFRGFALPDRLAPIIFINHQDSSSARMFTLAHELVHIWVGISAVSNLENTLTGENHIEKFCNHVAAELLVPLDELLNNLNSFTRSDLNDIGVILDKMKKVFKVSNLVILRRLLDASFLSRDEFNLEYSKLNAVTMQRRKSSGGNFHNTLRSRLGKRFSYAVTTSTMEGTTVYTDAFRLLGVNNAETVRRFAETVKGASF